MVVVSNGEIGLIGGGHGTWVVNHENFHEAHGIHYYYYFL